MKTAIIGLPMVGKTSLFTILTGVHEAGRVGAMETRIGVTKVPDARLDALAKIYEPPKVTHASIEFVDFPSISKEALREPAYLASLRVADSIAHVVRIFDDQSIPHEKGDVNPERDITDVDFELILSDLVVVEKRIERLDKDRKKIKDPGLDREYELLIEAKARLEDNQPLRTLELNDDDEKRLRGFQFLSQKPILYVLNLGENDASRLHEIEEEYRAKLLPGRPNAEVSAICGNIEAELVELPAAEAQEYLTSYGLKESGMNRMVQAVYRLLGLMSFLTAGETEVRAWTIRRGTKAPQAAGKIHTDIERGFIRAEIVNFDDLVDCGSQLAAKEKGLVRLEGKEYEMKDGDVVYFRFNV